MDAGSAEVLSLARAGSSEAFARLVAPHRRELRAHCYRMSGSLHDADDLLQESLLRAWRGLGTFEGRASLRTWLYRVTTNTCLDELDKRERRLRPQDLGPAARDGEPIAPPRNEPIWLEPCPSELYLGEARSPDSQYEERESMALAFLVALQSLPPRQRAVLILRDVLGWRASECAELLDLTVASVESALQRARETVSVRAERRRTEPRVPDAALSALLGRYVEAWEHADAGRLVALLREDATLAMPPYPTWLSGADAIGASLAAMVFGPVGPGAFRFVRTEANGQPALGCYQRDGATGAFRPVAIHVLSVSEGRIAAIDAFLDGSLVGLFGLPPAP